MRAYIEQVCAGLEAYFDDARLDQPRGRAEFAVAKAIFEASTPHNLVVTTFANLARCTGVTPSIARNAVKRLEAAGLVFSTSDRRGSCFSLTTPETRPVEVAR